MKKEKVLEALAAVKSFSWQIGQFFFWCMGAALLIYAVRFPFYDDSIYFFLKTGLQFFSVVFGLMVIFGLGFYLFEKSVIFASIVVLLFVAAAFSKCTSPSPDCIETRFISC